MSPAVVDELVAFVGYSLHVAGVGFRPLPGDPEGCFDVVRTQEVKDGSGVAKVGPGIEGVRHHLAAGVASADCRSRRSLQDGVPGVHPADGASVARLEPVTNGLGHAQQRAVRHLPEYGTGCGCTGPEVQRAVRRVGLSGQVADANRSRNGRLNYAEGYPKQACQ
jgi:hypothetical protein